MVTQYRSEGGPVSALDGVSLTVARGEVVALVGESGSGKSTLAQSVIGLLGTSGEITGGTITFDGETVDTGSERALRRIRGARIGFVPQDPRNTNGRGLQRTDRADLHVERGLGKDLMAGRLEPNRDAEHTAAVPNVEQRSAS